MKQNAYLIFLSFFMFLIFISDIREVLTIRTNFRIRNKELNRGDPSSESQDSAENDSDADMSNNTLKNSTIIQAKKNSSNLITQSSNTGKNLNQIEQSNINMKKENEISYSENSIKNQNSNEFNYGNTPRKFNNLIFLFLVYVYDTETFVKDSDSLAAYVKFILKKGQA